MNNLTVFTSSRSEYFILENLINFFYNKKIKFNITYLNQDCIKHHNHIDPKFNKLISKLSLNGILLNNSNIVKLSQLLLRKLNNETKYAVIYGDRVEAFAFALACFVKKIKIFHVGGGDITLGSMDNIYRNLISQISNYHFTTNTDSKKNLSNLVTCKYIYNFGYMYPIKKKLDALVTLQNLNK